MSEIKTESQNPIDASWFDQPVDRKGSHSMKWEDPADQHALWVADMDFKTAPAITEAIEKRASSGIYGYSVFPEEYFKAYQDWYRDLHDTELKRDGMVFSTGAIPALSSMVRKLSTPAEKVLVLSPVYNIFYNSIINNGRIPLESELVYDPQSQEYSIDFADLEEKLSDPQTRLMILCNPHNPVGKIWGKEELKKIIDLADKYGVTIISDEVHGDLTIPGTHYNPLASIEGADRHVSIYAPSKTFNLAGLQSAMVYTPDPFLFHQVWRGLNTDEVAEPNAFVIDATLAAFNDSRDWHQELRNYLNENRRLVEEILNPTGLLSVVPAKASYLSWIDASNLGNVEDFYHFLRQRGIHLSEGAEFGSGGENFLRLNYALNRKQLKEGLDALVQAARDYEKIHQE